VIRKNYFAPFRPGKRDLRQPVRIGLRLRK
jgi:hypothetical protein